MPPSTLDRPRTRAKVSDWVVIVPGQPSVDHVSPAIPVAPAIANPLFRPGLIEQLRGVLRSVTIPVPLTNAVRQFVPLVALAAAFVMIMGLVSGRNPLLVFGLVSPQFVAYQGTSTEPVRFVLDTGMSETAAVPGALLVNWSEDGTRPAMRLAMGNPTAEPEVSKLTADGKGIDEIRYRAAWPGVDAEIRAHPGGFASNFVVEPGIDPSVIELEYVGVTELTVDPSGRLRVRGPAGMWIDGTPESWQEGPSGREPVESRYELRGGGRFGFIVGPYDPSRALIVDPPSEQAE